MLGREAWRPCRCVKILVLTLPYLLLYTQGFDSLENGGRVVIPRRVVLVLFAHDTYNFTLLSYYLLFSEYSLDVNGVGTVPDLLLSIPWYLTAVLVSRPPIQQPSWPLSSSCNISSPPPFYLFCKRQYLLSLIIQSNLRMFQLNLSGYWAVVLLLKSQTFRPQLRRSFSVDLVFKQSVAWGAEPKTGPTEDDRRYVCDF